MPLAHFKPVHGKIRIPWTQVPVPGVHIEHETDWFVDRGASEVAGATPGVRCLDQPFQYIERGRLDSIAQQELAVARKSLDRRHQPQYETVMHFQRHPGGPGVVRAGFANV